MAVETATQALVASFFLSGIVLNAASATVVLYTRSHGKAVFRDSQRLVLVLFLLSSALWALIDFITVLLDTSPSTPCQIGVIFSTIFDQLARFSLEQFLLWALNNSNGAKVSVTQMIPQVMILARFLAGAVFIGFTRPQTDGVCVATTSTLPVGILVPALDAAIIVLLVVRAYSPGGVAKENYDGKGAEAHRARALMSVLLGLAIWTGTSVPLLIGIRSIALAARTALPAGGLLVVIVLVSAGARTLLTSRATSSPPEAPAHRRINISRDLSTADSDYPPSRYEDLKEAAIRSSTTFVNPREAPRVKDETMVGLPAGMEYAFLEDPMPPLPAGIAPVSGLARTMDRSGSQKKDLVAFGKGPKMAIGNPILQENATQNPLSKIAVMDLQAAAVAERERRARLQDTGAHVSYFDAQSMSMDPEEAMKRAASVKRKEVASVSLQQSTMPKTLQTEGFGLALTTSAQLSPGGDETRRRSPRQSIHEVEEQPAYQDTSPPQNRPLTSLPQYSLSPKAFTKPDIRPSRMRPPSPTTPPAEPTKTPLQRRPTVGLPTNPRARGLTVSQESGGRHKTILFVNNIEYNDPLVVEGIIKGASDKVAKTAPVFETSRASVVNRPRPIPRKAADSLAQASPTASLRRSKSAGPFGKKSLLSSTPGSPTQLPPLPALPRGATVRPRPHPNDTKSMTFEERVTFLFPSPPSARSIKRRSSVPDMPPIPLSFLDTTSSHGESNPHFSRATKASTQAESVLEVDEIPIKAANVSVNTTDEAGSAWLRAFGAEDDAGKPGKALGKPPTIPAAPVRMSAWTETTDDRSEDDATTSWSRVQSVDIAVGIAVKQKIGLPSSVRMPNQQDARDSKGPVSLSSNRTSATLPIMLDTSTPQQLGPQEPWLSEGEVMATPQSAVQSQWHRRVGDECPTFSARMDKSRSRKTPPSPLLLNSTTKRIVPVEPSPLESPGQALQQIQAQLKNLDVPRQDSPQSASRRLALLENLEREMGEQADHWKEIRHDFERDSMSSMQTTSASGKSSRRESLTASTKGSRESFRSSIGAERRASRIARMRGSGKENTLETSVRDSGSPQLSKWQKRLTEAQMEYMHLRSSNVNFLQLSQAQLDSPTPPDSDDSDQTDNEVPPIPSQFQEAVVKQPPVAQPRSISLWTPAEMRPPASTGFLWTFTPKPAPEVEVVLPGLSVRPAQRKALASLRIESSQLWRKPYNANHSATGLWRPVWACAAPPAEPLRSASGSQKPPRPVTLRPPRRHKRVTLLPDIPESPRPLSGSQETLGIFQFPWGERSDTASIQARPGMSMAMPGTMTSGGLSLGAVQPKQAEMTEYSSSFFDDYDDEVNGGDSTSDDGSSEDDEFDETTLWEIASLLKSDAVPSRDSLLPPSSNEVVDGYMGELGSDEEGQSSHEQSIVIGLAEPRELLSQKPREPAAIESSTVMMMLDEASEAKTPAPEEVNASLPANPKASMAPPASLAAIPATAQTAETTSKQGSTGLWNPPDKHKLSSAPPGGLFVSGSSRFGSRNTSEPPAAEQLSRKPRRTEQKPLDRLTSKNLWTRESAAEGGRNWILGEPKGKRSGHYQRLQASSEDWKAALHEAISASYPHIAKPKRIAAGPADWEAALQEAIALSVRPSPSRPVTFDPAVCHPVFGTRSLVTPSTWFHPAATGYTYNVASVHPVFFGSLAITCPVEAVHPAISAYAAKELHRQRSQQQQRQSNDQQVGTRSRSDSSSRRKEEIRAIQEHANSEVLPSIPAISAAAMSQTQNQSQSKMTRRDAIQAQIEALEQERQFAQQAARQTFMTPPPPPPPAVEEAGPIGFDSIQELQRHLSRQLHQSLVFANVKASAATATAMPIRTKSVSSTSSVRSPTQLKKTAAKASNLLWTPPVRTTTTATAAIGLWTPDPAAASMKPAAAVVVEDSEARTRRARRRRVVQRAQRRAEILAQIAAVERGVNPFVYFEGEELWRAKF